MVTTNNDDFIGAIVAEPRKSSIIMVLGVGGAGGNAVNHMYNLGIQDVSFMICNTDRQALDNSPIATKIQLGSGLGAGNDPNKGRNAAIENIDDVMVHLESEGIKMIFITAGMGGGTGTGAAPVIAKAAKNKGLLTVGIITLPFQTEGPKRIKHATEGLEELRQNTDALVVIHNDNISKIYGSLTIEDAFGKANDILATAAKGIAELVTRAGHVNVDFADVNTIMCGSGIALMGSARAEGEDKVESVVDEALNSPLLNHQDIRGAKDILFNLSYGTAQTLTFDEVNSVLKMIQQRASKNTYGNEANIIWGAGVNDSLGDNEIELTIVATGFENIDGRPIIHSPIIGVHEPTEKQIVTNNEHGVVVVNKERYQNIENIVNVPAFIRRNMPLEGGLFSSKVKIHKKEEETHNNESRQQHIDGELKF